MTLLDFVESVLARVTDIGALEEVAAVVVCRKTLYAHLQSVENHFVAPQRLAGLRHPAMPEGFTLVVRGGSVTEPEPAALRAFLITARLRGPAIGLRRRSGGCLSIRANLASPCW